MKDDTFETPLGKGGRLGVRVRYVALREHPRSTFVGAKGRIYKYSPRYGYSVNWTSMPKDLKNRIGLGIWEFFDAEELKLIKTRKKGKS